NTVQPLQAGLNHRVDRIATTTNDTNDFNVRAIVHAVVIHKPHHTTSPSYRLLPCYLVSHPRWLRPRRWLSVACTKEQLLMAGRDGLLHLISGERNEPQLTVRLRMKWLDCFVILHNLDHIAVPFPIF